MSAQLSATTFDLLDPLPRGRLAIQASAGTGKTYALAALATRFIAEQDVSAADLLIVTFTRAATSELRARVRDRLVQAAELLAEVPLPAEADELVTHLAAHDREQRLDRIRRAITEFDAATITTIHGFATQVLGTLGTAATTDPDAVLVDDSAELAAECCADVLAAAAAVHRSDDLPTHRDLVEATRTAINIPDLVLTPTPGSDGVPAKVAVLVDLVERSIALMRTRRRGAGTLSFDDILVELRAALDDGRGTAAIDSLRRRFRVALIDEFQDTDPVQWDIFRTLFGRDEDSTLVLVGDPKQAIYSFRGANVSTYLDAVSSGAERRTLGTNWRSDGAVLQATETLLAGTTYGSSQIEFSPVAAAPANESRRLTGADGADLPAVSVRLVSSEGESTSKAGDLKSPDAQRIVQGDLVDQVRELLAVAHLPTPDGAGVGRPVRPSDIAVLVLNSNEANDIQVALGAAGVPAVLARGDSVLESPAAGQWRWLLDALQRPSDLTRARTFALSWFCGRDAQWVHAANDAELVALQEELQSWSETLQEHGVIEFLQRVRTESGIVPRVLARPDGDRAMTDLDHVAELLQAAVPGGRASVAGLLSLLDAPPPVTVDADVDRDVVSRRVESEADAVQIMTIWVSKGLEFPIVCCPTMWRRSDNRVIYEDPDTGLRSYDLGKGAGWPDKAGAAARKALADGEASGERLRLLYVALTRAKHQTIVWWARYNRSATSPLARVLWGRVDGHIDPERYLGAKVPLPDDADMASQLAPLVAASDATIAATVVHRSAGGSGRWVDTAETDPGPALAAATLARPLDRSAHRWSFTAITSRSTALEDPYDASVGDAGAGDEDQADLAAMPAPLVAHDPALSDAPPTADEAGGAPGGAERPSGSALDLLPAGATFGTLVHSVLEHVDFAAPDLDLRLRTVLDDELAWRTMDLSPVGADPEPSDNDPSDEFPDAPVDTDQVGRALLVDGLRAAIETPMGPVAEGRSLRDLGTADRLDEMSFELLLGDDRRHPSVRQIGRLVLQHLPPGDLFTSSPLHDWAQRLADGEFAVSLAGHLTGSIDLVMRIRDGAGVPRYVVVDYKTNRLGERGVPAAPNDYRPDALAVAMTDHHYPLQALLYSVALHRYLRWRVADYDPAVHLGGAAYLFLRGMTGADVASVEGVPHGVFAWRPPSALVTELSDLLDGRRVTGVGS